MPELVQFWQIATQYQLLHTAALAATAALPDHSALPAAAGFLAGALAPPSAAALQFIGFERFLSAGDASDVRTCSAQ